MSGAEEWRPIPDLEWYEASSMGRIRSLDRTLSLVGRWGEMLRFHRGRVLKLKDSGNGHLVFSAGKKIYRSVSRAVTAAFHGEPMSGDLNAAHLDGNPSNNKAANLLWATMVEIAAGKESRGTAPIGSANGMHVLSESDIALIIDAYVGGATAESLAQERGVSTAAILTVIRGDRWNHVPVAAGVRHAAKEMACRNIRLARERSNLRRHNAAAHAV